MTTEQRQGTHQPQLAWCSTWHQLARVALLMGVLTGIVNQLGAQSESTLPAVEKGPALAESQNSGVFHSAIAARISGIRNIPADKRLKLLAQIISIDPEGNLLIRDATGEIHARANHPQTARAGDTVELIGFPDQEPQVTLDRAIYRVVAPSGSKARDGTNRVDWPPAPYLPLLQDIQAVRQLSREEAALQFPVRLRGTVTFWDAHYDYLFVQQGQNGIFIQTAKTNLALKLGQIVEVTGFSVPGQTTPTIFDATVMVEAQGELPTPQPWEAEPQLAGRDSGRWSVLEGIVCSAGDKDLHLWLRIVTPTGLVRMMIPPGDSFADAGKFINAAVRIHGVSGVEVNQQRKITGSILYAQRMSDIEITAAGPADPWAAPLVSASSLAQINAGGKPSHRVRVRGVVTMQRKNHSFYLQDSSGPLWVDLQQPTEVLPGDDVEVVGFPSVGRRAVALQSVVFRKMGTTAAPKPVPLTLTEGRAGLRDAQYVTIDARLIKISITADTPTLFVESKSSAFEVAIAKPTAFVALSKIQPGSLLRLAGIASTQNEDQGNTRSFRLLLASEADVTVLQGPPWWTKRHAIALAGSLGLVIMAAFAWVILLRREVWKQTSIIRAQLAEESRLKSRYHELFENAHDIIYTTDLEGRLTSFNRAAEITTGTSRLDALGQTLTRFVESEDAQRIALRDLAQLRSLTAAKYEVTMLAQDGRRVPVEVSTQPIVDTGRVVGIQGIARDITERKQAEEAIRRLNLSLERRVAERTAELEASNKELEAFSYSVSHDLRAPLRAVNGFAEILLKDFHKDLAPTAQRYLRTVAEGGRKMGRLVDDLLTFSRMSRQTIAKHPIDIAECAHAIVHDLRQIEPHRQVSVRIHPMPQAAGDRSLIGQALQNLIANAWKFTQERTDAVIELGSEERDGETVFYVRDNGVGFDMKYSHRLFGVFQRLHRDEDFPGTGVGLAIVQRIIHRHGGKVWADGRPGEGATFYFTLPEESEIRLP